MKFSFSRILFFLSILSVPVASLAATSGHLGNVDPNYDVEQTIRKGRDARRADAQSKFDNDPRESTLRLTVAPSLLFGMHSDLSDGDGWGLNASVLVQANSDTPDFKFLIGGEVLALTAESDSGGNDISMDTINLMLTLGFAYDFSPHFAMGALWGYGLVGFTYIEENFANGSAEESGTMSTVLSFKPYVEFMMNKNFSVYAAYRFVYIGSSFISTAADWGDLETATHAVEFGCCYRF